MPYSAEHRARTKQKIIKAGRRQFNLHGFDGVSIDQIMQVAGLSRGGFYHHFKDKEAIFAQAVNSFCTELTGAVDAHEDLSGPDAIKAFMSGYLSDAHLMPDGEECPMIAVPSDVSRRDAQAKHSYQRVFETMLELFETNLSDTAPEQRRSTAMMLSIVSVGGMVLARAIEDEPLQGELLQAARDLPERLDALS